MKKILISCLFTSVAFANVSYVNNTQTLKEGGSEISLKTNYFLSSQKVDPVRSATNFEDGESFEMLDLTLMGHYGLTDKFQGHVGANFRMNQSNQLVSGEISQERVNGAESLIIGFKYNWKRQDGMQYAMFGEYGQRLYSVQAFKDAADVGGLTLGDNGPYATFGFNASYITKAKNFFSLKLHYHNPGSDLSSEILTELESAFVWKKSTLLLGITNVSSMNQDPFSDDINDKPLIAQGNSELFNSINRSFTSGYMGLNFAMGKKWRLETKLSHTFLAVSSDLGTNFIVSFVRRNESDKTFQKKDQAFKEYQFEASVTKIGKTRNVVIIDKGFEEGINKGDKVDFYFFDYLGGNELIATGVVVKTSSEKAMVKITKRYSKKRVESGTLARIGLINN